MCIIFCAIFGWSDGVSAQADIVKQIWAELPKHMSTPVAPLDEEMLSELAKVPAVVEGRDSLFFVWWLEIRDLQNFTSSTESDWKRLA